MTVHQQHNSWKVDRRHSQAWKSQWHVNCVLIQLYKYVFTPSQAKKKLQCNWIGQLEWLKWQAAGKTDLPLINFRSRERHQQDLVPPSYHGQGVAKEDTGGDKNRKKERHRGCDLSAHNPLVNDNIANLAVRKITTRNKWNSPASSWQFPSPGGTQIMQIL